MNKQQIMQRIQSCQNYICSCPDLPQHSQAPSTPPFTDLGVIHSRISSFENSASGRRCSFVCKFKFSESFKHEIMSILPIHRYKRSRLIIIREYHSIHSRPYTNHRLLISVEYNSSLFKTSAGHCLGHKINTRAMA